MNELEMFFQTNRMAVKPLVYLASPYSHSDHQVKEKRFKEVCAAAADLMKKGFLVFCPIAHSHPIEVYGMPGEFQNEKFWLEQDFGILRYCGALIVAQIDGWDRSSGVGKEITFCQERNIPVFFYNPETKEII